MRHNLCRAAGGNTNAQMAGAGDAYHAPVISFDELFVSSGETDP
jgi:hypothetical protein